MAHSHLLSIPVHLHFLAISHQIINHVRSETTFVLGILLAYKGTWHSDFCVTKLKGFSSGCRGIGVVVASLSPGSCVGCIAKIAEGWRGEGKKKTGLKSPGGRGHIHKFLSMELEDSSLQVNHYMQNEGEMEVYKIISKIEIK